MQWLNEPPDWQQQAGGRLVVRAAPHTDFWRRTHYGFVRDNGHLYGETVKGDFVADVKVSGAYATLYDQAGLMVRLDETCWLKTGIEYVNGVQYASAVVTNEYSDWSITALPSQPESIWIRVKRVDSAVEVSYALDGEHYHLLRMAHLTSASVKVGPMCAAPDGDGFEAIFEGFTITPLD